MARTKRVAAFLAERAEALAAGLASGGMVGRGMRGLGAASRRPDHSEVLQLVPLEGTNPESTDISTDFSVGNFRKGSLLGQVAISAEDVVVANGGVWKGEQTIEHVPAEWRGKADIGGKHEVWCLLREGMFFYLKACAAEWNRKPA